jgi:uncharacterized protein YndB with AHSA1/START domain
MAQVKVKHGILVRRPPADVFAFVSDPDKMPIWQSTLHQVKDKKETKQGKLQKQARVRDHRNVLGKDIDSEYEVVDYQQDKSVTLRVAEGPVSFQMKWDLEAVDGGTFFTAEGGGDLGDLELSEPAAQASAQHLLESDLKTLRDVLERDHKG